MGLNQSNKKEASKIIDDLISGKKKSQELKVKVPSSKLLKSLRKKDIPVLATNSAS